MSPSGNVARILGIVVIGLIMVPVAFGLLGCTLCAVSGGFTGHDHLVFAIAALVCLGILLGGIFLMGRLAKQMGPSEAARRENNNG